MFNPEYIIVVIGFLGFFGGLTSVGLTLYRAGRMAPEEEGRIPIFNQRVGGRIGFLRYKGPMLRFALYDDMAVVVAMRRIYVIDQHNLQSVELKRILFAKYVELSVQDQERGLEKITLNMGNAERVVELMKTSILNT